MLRLIAYWLKSKVCNKEVVMHPHHSMICSISYTARIKITIMKFHNERWNINKIL